MNHILKSISNVVFKRKFTQEANESPYVMRRSLLAVFMGYPKQRVDKNTRRTLSNRIFG
jgi:hypothetical protein